MTESQINDLIGAAAKVRERAYAPYSEFQVGAALLTEHGQIFAGCNVENASYGLSICAERMAIGQAVAQGHRNIVAVAVVAHPMATPCGACRQFIAEFGNEIQVICASADDLTQPIVKSIDDLLPDSFSLRD